MFRCKMLTPILLTVLQVAAVAEEVGEAATRLASTSAEVAMGASSISTWVATAAMAEVRLTATIEISEIKAE